MPIPAAAAIGAGASLVSSALGAYSQGRTNKRSREFSREMYQRQKDDALAFWRMQNSYNSPAMQMRRFKQAGLNPNLIYGRGSAGQASPINVPSKPDWNPQSPVRGDVLGGVVQGYFDTKMKAATVNNLGAQNEVLKQDARLKNAQRISTLIGAVRSNFDYGLRKEARDSLLLSLKSAGADANAMANLHTYQATNEIKKGDLMQQSFDFLDQYNVKKLEQIGIIVRNLRKSGRLTEANISGAIRRNRLIGISDKTEIGSLVRAIMTVFGFDPSGSFKSK